MERGISLALDKDGTQYCHEETLVWRWHLSPSPIRVWGTRLWQAHLAGAALVSSCAPALPRRASHCFSRKAALPGLRGCSSSGPAPHHSKASSLCAHKGIQQAALQQHFPWHKTATVASVEGNGSGASSQDRMGGVLGEQ